MKAAVLREINKPLEIEDIQYGFMQTKRTTLALLSVLQRSNFNTLHHFVCVEGFEQHRH